jgi:hypothetical protein
MALYTSLPLYQVAYQLLGVSVDYVQNMPRAFKASIGMRLSGLCVEIVLLICKANSALNKLPHLDALLERNEELQILLRLCQDKRFISKPQYANAVELTTSVGRQVNGWRRKYATAPAM